MGLFEKNKTLFFLGKRGTWDAHQHTAWGPSPKKKKKKSYEIGELLEGKISFGVRRQHLVTKREKHPRWTLLSHP